MRLRAAGRVLAAPLILAIVVATAATAGAALTTGPNANLAGAAVSSWHVQLVSTADLEGPPVVAPGSDEAFALHGNDGEEVASEPLERINLLSGAVVVGPRVPDDAHLGVVGTTVVLVAPATYSTSGVATRPWSIWTVNPVTLRLERPLPLAFVSDFDVVIPTVDAAPATFALWVSNGAALRLVDLAGGKVLRTIRIPALALSIDPTGRRLYVLTGAGGSISSGSAYRTGTIVELDARTGSIVATSRRWTQSPQLQIAASGSGVYVTDAGRSQRSEVFLSEHGLRSVDLPSSVESAVAASLKKADPVATTPVEHGAVVDAAGRLTCISPGATSVRASTALGPIDVSWDVFAERATALYAWNFPSTAESSRIESIAAPALC